MNNTIAKTRPQRTHSPCNKIFEMKPLHCTANVRISSEQLRKTVWLCGRPISNIMDISVTIRESWTVPCSTPFLKYGEFTDYIRLVFSRVFFSRHIWFYSCRWFLLLLNELLCNPRKVLFLIQLLLVMCGSCMYSQFKLNLQCTYYAIFLLLYNWFLMRFDFVKSAWSAWPEFDKNSSIRTSFLFIYIFFTLHAEMVRKFQGIVICMNTSNNLLINVDKFE